jgi:hypothetical protein
MQHAELPLFRDRLHTTSFINPLTALELDGQMAGRVHDQSEKPRGGGSL